MPTVLREGKRIEKREFPWEIKRGKSKSWVALVSFDPDTRGFLTRAFFDKSGKEYYEFEDELKPGDIIEFGYDFYAGGGEIKHRAYTMVVHDEEHDLLMFSGLSSSILEVDDTIRPTEDQLKSLGVMPHIECAKAHLYDGDFGSAVTELTRATDIITDNLMVVSPF